MLLIFGTEVVGTADRLGELRAVELDLAARKMTAMIVEPDHRKGMGRFVPASSIVSAEQTVSVDMSVATFADCEPAEAGILTQGVANTYTNVAERLPTYQLHTSFLRRPSRVVLTPAAQLEGVDDLKEPRLEGCELDGDGLLASLLLSSRGLLRRHTTTVAWPGFQLTESGILRS